MQEIWKDIPQYKGLYMVSNLGRVKSLPKLRCKREKILKNKITKDGYYETSLSKNGKTKFIRTHRLVAIAFIENVFNKEQVNHIDGNKLNNCVDNLEWCTLQENKEHAIKIGLQDFVGEKNPRAKSVIQYNLDNCEIARFKTLREAMKCTGVLENKISNVCNHHSKTAGGYIWKFESEVV